MVVPLYKAQFDNVTYFIPSCSDPVQMLWRPDGSMFNLTCEGITLESGELMAVPGEFPPDGCHNVTASNASACFLERFPSWRTTNGEVACHQVNEAASRKSRDDGGVHANLTQISDQLASLTDQVSSAAGNAANQGLAAVGCAAQAAFQQVTAYYFNMA